MNDRSSSQGSDEELPFIPVCAWCESVRTSEGTWLPIGHYIPRDGPFELTHGICPPCAGDLQSADARGRRPEDGTRVQWPGAGGTRTDEL